MESALFKVTVNPQCKINANPTALVAQTVNMELKIKATSLFTGMNTLCPLTGCILYKSDQLFSGTNPTVDSGTVTFKADQFNANFLASTPHTFDARCNVGTENYSKFDGLCLALDKSLLP